jgi:hypothetical protein
MAKRITRRRLAASLALAAPPLVRPSPAQTPAAPSEREQLVEVERIQNRRAAEALRKVPLPAGSEPAFLFRA